MKILPLLLKEEENNQITLEILRVLEILPYDEKHLKHFFLEFDIYSRLIGQLMLENMCLVESALGIIRKMAYAGHEYHEVQNITIDLYIQGLD